MFGIEWEGDVVYGNMKWWERERERESCIWGYEWVGKEKRRGGKGKGKGGGYKQGIVDCLMLLLLLLLLFFRLLLVGRGMDGFHGGRKGNGERSEIEFSKKKKKEKRGEEKEEKEECGKVAFEQMFIFSFFFSLLFDFVF